MTTKLVSYVVATDNGRERIDVSTLEEAETAKRDMERRHGRIVMILPIRKTVTL